MNLCDTLTKIPLGLVQLHHMVKLCYALYNLNTDLHSGYTSLHKHQNGIGFL